jgi:hypothetical protein
MAKTENSMAVVQRRAIHAWHVKEAQHRKLLERAQTVQQEMSQLEHVIYACGGGVADRKPTA